MTILKPAASKPYYRLIYTDRDGRRKYPNAGLDAATALAKAERLNLDLARAAGENDQEDLATMVARYVSTPGGRKRDKSGQLLDEDWTPNHWTKVRQGLNRAISGLSDDQRRMPISALDGRTIDLMRSACGTRGMVRETTRHVRGFPRWAYEARAITRERLEFLPMNAPVLDPRFPQPSRRPRRHRNVRVQGRADIYVGEEDCPTPSKVVALAKQMQMRVGWGALAVYLAVATGLRIGELIQLTADDVVRVARGWQIAVDWQRDNNSGSKSRRALPKHGKRRAVPVGILPDYGFDLRDELLARVEVARQEQLAGRNPDALLFPAARGGMWWSSNLNDLIVSAQKDAGWEYVVVDEVRNLNNGTRAMVKVTPMVHTRHSLRHRFARDMIDTAAMPPGRLLQVGGWESLSVAETRTGAEHLDAAFETMNALA
ncbi:tyrosine-type recombinase/integrase [Cellulomonas uda]|uniref:tyrosine-type recombinase/integrase n=1 Tax=Cellulomonas uda TaxID=1714 RepID=UPI00141B8297|nr:tyrosine-type recombinase/integrase [Cellulomonas uda]NII65555.1 integrase [Cellulomonas uda]